MATLRADGGGERFALREVAGGVTVLHDQRVAVEVEEPSYSLRSRLRFGH
jgi:hypothetical protein